MIQREPRFDNRVKKKHSLIECRSTILSTHTSITPSFFFFFSITLLSKIQTQQIYRHKLLLIAWIALANAMTSTSILPDFSDLKVRSIVISSQKVLIWGTRGGKVKLTSLHHLKMPLPYKRLFINTNRIMAPFRWRIYRSNILYRIECLLNLLKSLLLDACVPGTN